MWRNTKRHLLVSLAGALIFTLICGSGILMSLDQMLAEADQALYADKFTRKAFRASGSIRQ